MKNFITLIAISIIAFSCSKEEQEIKLEENKITKLNRGDSKKEYSNNSLVVKFVSGTSESDKQLLRNFYEVKEYKLCEHCGDNAIELWTFEEGIEIEPKKTTIDDPVGGMHCPLRPQSDYVESVDSQFEFMLANINSTNNVNTSSSSSTTNDYQSYIKSVNDGITIAVFDSGIIPDYGGDTPTFYDTFLYNALNDGIPGINSGWDFVNHDDDCYDDNPGVHGTAVSSIITTILNSNQYNIPHQILPLKVCNADGIANYFDFLCALNYALPRAEILNMSLGWYDENSGDIVDNIFLDLMNQYPNTIIVNSAGNETNNNDINVHCPSGYPINNIIAIASCDENLSYVSNFSNYGAFSVDFYANGENIDFLGYNLNGTSFAAPKVTAMVAKLKYQNPNFSPNEILNNLDILGIAYPYTFDINKPTLYSKILKP